VTGLARCVTYSRLRFTDASGFRAGPIGKWCRSASSRALEMRRGGLHFRARASGGHSTPIIRAVPRRLLGLAAGVAFTAPA
jgi:hypothetical protein